MKLDRLLRPRNVAVFGGGWAENVVEQCQRSGFEGEIWPVHPTRSHLGGLPCYRDIASLPSPPDASFLGVNRELTIELVAQLADGNAGGAVCFASGFSEAAAEDDVGVALEKALLEAARDMPIVGPNCYGLINYIDGAPLWPDQHGGVRLAPGDRGVALITQSSNIAINLTMQKRGLPLAYVLTAGNQAQLSLATLGRAMLADARVTALGLHIEGYGDIDAFTELAIEAHAMGKCVVVLKVGRTEASRSAMVSHTSSLTGSAAASDAFLSQLGLISVPSLSVMLEALKIVHVHGRITGSAVLSMSCSGGEAGLMGDAIAEQGLECPDLTDAQRHGLREALGPRVALANPLDYHTYIWNDRVAMQDMMQAMLWGSNNADLAILVLDFPREDRCDYPSWLVALDAFCAASGIGNSVTESLSADSLQGGSVSKRWPGAVAVLASLPENLPESIATDLHRCGIVTLLDLDASLMAVASIVRSAGAVPDGLPVLETASVPAPEQLSEAGLKQWLRSLGIPVPMGVVVTEADIRYLLDSGSTTNSLHPDTAPNRDAERALAALNPPWVVKCTGLAHKSDSNGVVLGVQSAEELMNALTLMPASQDYLVECQVEHGIAELLVGVVRDPVHGYLLTLGAGGVQTELLNDTTHLLLPTTPAAVEQALNTLRVAPVLHGYRGKPGINFPALIDVLMTLQNVVLGCSHWLEELEINPLICTSDRCTAADVLLSIRPSSPISDH